MNLWPWEIILFTVTCQLHATSLSHVQDFMWSCRDELAPAKALLRLQHLAHEVPSANRCNPAAHLANYALHAVTKRMRKLTDPRMHALSSVVALESLWVGSRANFPGLERMPVRRRRGDVHADLTTVVIRLAWPGMPYAGWLLDASSHYQLLLGVSEQMQRYRGCTSELCCILGMVGVCSLLTAHCQVIFAPFSQLLRHACGSASC